ncbi:MAG: MFS transporter [Burkholderiaceae bacterium]
MADLLVNGEFRQLWTIGMLTFIVRWLEILAFGVYGYAQTGSTVVVAMLTMLRLLPMGLFGMLFGIMAARWSRRRGVFVYLWASWLTTLVLAFVAHAGMLEIWHLALASAVNGAAWAADNPFRRAMIGDAVGPLHMGLAMSLDVGASNASRLAGPAIGGLLLAHAGIEGIFVFGLLAYSGALLAARPIGSQQADGTGQGQPAASARRRTARGAARVHAWPAPSG